MIFNKEDYNGLSFDIFKAKEKDDILSVLPELKDIKSFTKLDFEIVVNTGVTSIGLKERTKLIKYIVLVYDKESPFIQRFKSLPERKKQAAVTAGFDPKDPIIDVLQDVSSDDICSMIIDFVVYQNDLIWSMLISNEQTFYEYQNTLMSPTMMIRNDKDKLSGTAVKTKLLADSHEIAARINSYRKQLFVDDSVNKKIKASYSPERVANTI